MAGISIKDILFSCGSFQHKAIKLLDHLIGGLIASLLPVRHLTTVSIPEGCLKILIIRPGGMGDAVFLLPLLRSLQQQGHVIDVLCERRNSAVFLSQQGLFHRIFHYDILADFWSVFQQQYDVVVDTEQWHHLSAVVAYALRRQVSIGFDTRPSRARLFDIKVSYDLNQHELASFFRLFDSFGISGPVNLPLSFHVAAHNIQWAKEKMTGAFIVLSLGGSIEPRRFTLDQALDICRCALERNRAVVLLGGRDVMKFSHQIKQAFSDGRVVDFAGTLSLAQSSALISQAERFFGQDSGLLHVAVALGISVTAFFGPGNAAKWGPRGALDTIVTKNFSCSPCTRFGYTVVSCHNKYPCRIEDNIDV